MSCSAVKKDSFPCMRKCKNESKFCWQHSYKTNDLDKAVISDKAEMYLIFKENIPCNDKIWCDKGKNNIDYYKYILIQTNPDFVENATIALSYLYDTIGPPTEDHLQFIIKYYDYISDECVTFVMLNAINKTEESIRKIQHLASIDGDSDVEEIGNEI
jgi:hypothetical protein